MMLHRQTSFNPAAFAALPGAGSKVIFFGDSISDRSGSFYGHWAMKLCDRFGWVWINQNQVQDGSFENDTVGSAPPTTSAASDGNATLTVGNTIATMPPGTGTHYVSATATAAGTSIVNFGGSSGAFRNNMELGQTYIFSAWVRCGSTVTPGNVFLQFNSTGNTVPSANSASLSAAQTWQRLSVSLSLVNGTDAWVRAVSLSAPASSVIQVDGVMVQRGTTLGSSYEDFGTRGAIAGSNLQVNDHTASNGSDTFAARVAAYGPLDAVIVEYGMNDLYYVNAASPPYTPTTLATWSSAVSTCIANIQAMAGPPKIIWLGINNSYDTFTNPAWAISRQDAVRQMDAITQALVTAAGGWFIPMCSQMDYAFVDVGGANPRHPTKPVGENFMYERIVRFLEMGT
jgi:hypothetical protein